MISGGKMYQADDSFKELSDHSVSNHSADKSGVVILWEVLPAKYTRQAQYLHDGSSWQSYSSLEKAMTDTGFAASKECSPFMQGSVENKQQVSNVDEHIQVSHQLQQSEVEQTNHQPQQEQSVSLLNDDINHQLQQNTSVDLLNFDVDINNRLSGLIAVDNAVTTVQLLVDLPSGDQLNSL